MSGPAPHRWFKFEGRIYTVINPSPVEWLPGNPVADPEANLDLRDLRKALWAVNRGPEMAYMLRSSHTDGRFFARLHIDPQKLPVIKKGEVWTVDKELQNQWARLEGSLIYISNILLQAVHGLPESKFPFDAHWPFPHELGYLENHKSHGAAARAVWKARDALFLLAARCSLAVALTNLLPSTSSNSPPQWQQILMNADVTYTWIDELNQSLIPDLSPGLRVGAFINPHDGPTSTEWVNHVPCMIKANLPVYIYWPTSDGQVWETIIKKYPFLLSYRPYSTDVPEMEVSGKEHVTRDRRGRFHVVNPQNSFRWEDVRGTRTSVVPDDDASPELSAPHGQGQRSGESFKDFQARRAALVRGWEEKETDEKKEQRLARQAAAAACTRPTRRSNTLIFLWTTVGDVDPTVHYSLLSQPYRMLVGHHKAGEVWNQYPKEAKHYDAWHNEWDIVGEMTDDAWDALAEGYPDPGPNDTRNAIPQTVSASMDCIASELSALYQAEPDIAAFTQVYDDNVTIFRERYGINSVQPSEQELVSSSSPYLTYPPDVIRKHFSLPLASTSAEDVPDFPVHAVSAFITLVLGKAPSTAVSGQVWDLDPRSSVYLGHPTSRHPSLRISVWDVDDTLRYAIHYTGGAPCWFDVLVDAVTALELYRRRSITSQRAALDFLSDRGITFRTVYDPHPHDVRPRSFMSPTDGCLGWRPPSFRPTEWDYHVYEARAYEILRSPRGRAAVLHGGIIWRLAIEILGGEPSNLANIGPSTDVFDHGQAIRPRHGPPYYDDALSPEEIDIVCGTYKIMESGHKDPVYYSWWPRPAQWNYSGMNVGYWTPFCESWFNTRLQAIRASNATPHGSKEWRNKITFYQGARKLRRAVEVVSEKFLKDVLRVPSA
ncbi:hypothetical protein TRAPUB_2129 [Trametes pubescens]|uniref:Uncharacterized protein n=1 Tax=Trametes pubescens TaxID=154538 RepID=A0A1M2VHF1_TRAPU|nr:hypothetical protein TRAPUB_2129 [Trametes pubescens]